MTYTTSSTGTYSWTTTSTSTSNTTHRWSTPILSWTSFPAPPPKKKEIVISEEDFLNVLEGDDN